MVLVEKTLLNGSVSLRGRVRKKTTIGKTNVAANTDNRNKGLSE